MNCVNCGVKVSPNFVAAIIENRCPACGQQLMDGAEYKKLTALRKQLVPLGLGLDDATLTKVAAAITSRFELWPRDSDPASPVPAQDVLQHETDIGVAPETSTQVIAKPAAPKPIRPKNQHEAEELVRSRFPGVDFDDDVPLSLAEDDGDDFVDGVSNADLIREFGLDKGEATSVAMSDSSKTGDPILNAMLSGMPLQGDMPVPGSAESRMDRAQALQETANSYGIKPMTGRRS
jgi:hypothetical protein